MTDDLRKLSTYLLQVVRKRHSGVWANGFLIDSHSSSDLFRTFFRQRSVPKVAGCWARLILDKGIDIHIADLATTSAPIGRLNEQVNDGETAKAAINVTSASPNKEVAAKEMPLADPVDLNDNLDHEMCLRNPQPEDDKHIDITNFAANPNDEIGSFDQFAEGSKNFEPAVTNVTGYPNNEIVVVIMQQAEDDKTIQPVITNLETNLEQEIEMQNQQAEIPSTSTSLWSDSHVTKSPASITDRNYAQFENVDDRNVLPTISLATNESENFDYDATSISGLIYQANQMVLENAHETDSNFSHKSAGSGITSTLCDILEKVQKEMKEERHLEHQNVFRQASPIPPSLFMAHRQPAHEKSSSSSDTFSYSTESSSDNSGRRNELNKGDTKDGSEKAADFWSLQCSDCINRSMFVISERDENVSSNSSSLLAVKKSSLSLQDLSITSGGRLLVLAPTSFKNEASGDGISDRKIAKSKQGSKILTSTPVEAQIEESGDHANMPIMSNTLPDSFFSSKSRRSLGQGETINVLSNDVQRRLSFSSESASNSKVKTAISPKKQVVKETRSSLLRKKASSSPDLMDNGDAVNVSATRIPVPQVKDRVVKEKSAETTLFFSPVTPTKVSLESKNIGKDIQVEPSSTDLVSPKKPEVRLARKTLPRMGLLKSQFLSQKTQMTGENGTGTKPLQKRRSSLPVNITRRSLRKVSFTGGLTISSEGQKVEKRRSAPALSSSLPTTPSKVKTSPPDLFVLMTKL